ncbi:MAG: DNA polymerase III subunit chi [Aeromonas sp.]
MSHVVFYLLTAADTAEASALERAVCQLCAEQWPNGHVYVYCQDEPQALRIDELLWQLPSERFVPHQLQGEQGQAPVEIGHRPPARRYARLINLTTQVPPFAAGFGEVIDFVPSDEGQKQLARERYKQYRQAGHTLVMQDALLDAAASA